jgi:two-component system nitrogen regulation response regulator NtrX
MFRENIETAAQHRKHTLVGQSASIQALLKMIHRIRESNAHVLIYGETGTGKEVVARLLRSSLPNGVLCPFVAVDSATIHGQTAESILFGHEKGAFTGADKLRKGVFEEANGGTVYFDEIANMPLDIQAKLLRVIQEKEVIRMGSARAIPLEFRVIAATNRDLDEMVKQRLFKDDLLQRLNVIPILLPSLRDRIGDIPSLIDHFCSLHSRGMREVRFTERAMAVLQRYRWPGNIRELGNLVAFLYATSESDEIDIYDLPPKFSEQCSVVGKYSSADAPRLSLDVEGPFYERVAQFEKQVLSREYDKFKGNVSRMALALQMDRSHLHSKLRALGIHSKDRASAETFI